jgi:hypothetical protein
MWDSKQIVKAIRSSEVDDELQPNHIHLHLFDLDSQIGIGADGKGNTVLVLPGQQDAFAFETEFSSYDPWSNLVVFESSTQLNGVSILRCNIEIEDEATIEAAAAIFYGLIDLQEKFGETGKAIWQLKSLFANRLKFELADSTITGLLGELLIVSISKNPSLAVRFWHSNIDDKFDFSGSNFRLEVKSTSTGVRSHHFSSHQIPGNVPEKTFVASVQIVRVEGGTTLSEIIADLSLKLDVDELTKVTEIIHRTLGVPADLVHDYQIDLEATRLGIKLLKGPDVPSPSPNDGVISMEWLANLEGVAGMTSFYEDFFELNS